MKRTKKIIKQCIKANIVIIIVLAFVMPSSIAFYNPENYDSQHNNQCDRISYNYGANNDVYAIVEWRGDLIIGGAFTEVSGVSANCIARWDGNQWHSIGQGTESTVTSLAVYNNDLIAGGYFNHVYNTDGEEITAHHIARWDGDVWDNLRYGLSAQVQALTVWNNKLIVGGQFQYAMNYMPQNYLVNNIAIWDGELWSRFNTGEYVGMDSSVYALSVFNGDLVAGGYFQFAENTYARFIAYYHDNNWQSFDNQLNQYVLCTATYDGKLIASGTTNEAGSTEYINYWDGSHWAQLGGGASGGGYAVHVHTLDIYNGDLIAGGTFTNLGSTTVNRIARWDGSTWNPLGSGMSGVLASVRSVDVYNGDLIAGGDFEQAGGITVNNITRWNGNVWNTIEPDPELSFSPDEIHFGTHNEGWTGSDTFMIWNSGDKTLEYSISENLEWITSINPSSGSVSEGYNTITVNIGDTYPMSGYYSGTIDITSNGGIGSIFVDITLNDLPSTVYVDESYTGPDNCGGHTWQYDAFDNIQDGINGVEPEGVVEVHSGEYHEHVVANKRMYLRGAGMGSTVIDGDSVDEYDVVRITADYVTISGFTIRDSGNWDPINDGDDDAGIDITSSYNTIEYNTIIDNFHGILMRDSSMYNTITGNTISNNARNGIDTPADSQASHNIISHNIIADQQRGIRLCSAHQNSIYDNTFTNNGIFIGQGTTTGYYSTNNHIYYNEFEFNGIYIQEYSGKYNRIYNNNFRWTGSGVWMAVNTENNRVYHNNFLVDDAAADYGSNYWDNGYTDDSYGGNFWADYDWTHDAYKGSAQQTPGQDGVGDIETGGRQPHSITGGASDNFPFVESNGWNKNYGTCFLAGTQITMADGSHMNIEDIQIGDMVSAFDEKEQRVVSAPVTNVFHHTVEQMSNSYLIINQNLKVTSNHPLYVNGKWIPAGKTIIGDNLQNIKGVTIPILSIEKVNKRVPTYNLEVETYHTYFAEDILVHNKETPELFSLFCDDGGP